MIFDHGVVACSLDVEVEDDIEEAAGGVVASENEFGLFGAESVVVETFEELLEGEVDVSVSVHGFW